MLPRLLEPSFIVANLMSMVTDHETDDRSLRDIPRAGSGASEPPSWPGRVLSTQVLTEML
jgi:hypothetical protein